MPQFKDTILQALENADFSVYPDSMSGLVAKDAKEAAADIAAGVGKKEECACCDGAEELCKRFGVSF